MRAQQTPGTTSLHDLGATQEAVTSTTSPVVALDASSEQRPSEDEFSSAAPSVSPATTQALPSTDPEPLLTPETGKYAQSSFMVVPLAFYLMFLCFFFDKQEF